MKVTLPREFSDTVNPSPHAAALQALAVVAADGRINRFLTEHDPMALRQVTKALTDNGAVIETLTAASTLP